MCTFLSANHIYCPNSAQLFTASPRAALHEPHSAYPNTLLRLDVCYDAGLIRLCCITPPWKLCQKGETQCLRWRVISEGSTISPLLMPFKHRSQHYHLFSRIPCGLINGIGSCHSIYLINRVRIKGWPFPSDLHS